MYPLNRTLPTNIFLGFILLIGCREEEFEVLPNPNVTVSKQVYEQAYEQAYYGGITLLTTFNDQLIVVGDFTTIGGIEAWGIAAFDGTDWSPLGDGLLELAGRIEDMQEFEGELYITGWFDGIGGEHSPNLARWDGENWKAVSGGIDYGDTYADEYNDESILYDLDRFDYFRIGGFSLEIFNDELYIGGGSVEGKNILVKWDGTQLTPVIDYPDVAGTSDLITFQNTLYGVVQLGVLHTLARFDGHTWTPVIGGEWNGMEVYQGKIYGRSGTWDGNQFESITYPIECEYIQEKKSIGDHLFILVNPLWDCYTGPRVMRWDGAEWSTIYESQLGLNSIGEFQGRIYLGGYSESGGGLLVLME